MIGRLFQRVVPLPPNLIHDGRPHPGLLELCKGRASGNGIELLGVPDEHDTRRVGPLGVIHEGPHVLAGHHRGFVDQQYPAAVVVRWNIAAGVRFTGPLGRHQFGERLSFANDGLQLFDRFVRRTVGLDLIAALGGVVGEFFGHEGLASASIALDA